MSRYPEAVIILIDNSETSINGDYSPKRIDAQKIAVERLTRYYMQIIPHCQIGIGASASGASGIFLSLSKNIPHIHQAVARIQVGGRMELYTSICKAMLALRRKEKIEIKGRIVVFIGSLNDLNEKKCNDLIYKAKLDKISIDIVVFGTEVNNILQLARICSSLTGSRFVNIDDTRNMLSDSIMISSIGSGFNMNSLHSSDPLISQVDMNYLAEEEDLDEETLEAVRQSLKDYSDGED